VNGGESNSGQTVVLRKNYPVTTATSTAGHSIETSDEFALTSSHGYGTRWFLDWRNISSSTARVSTYAICAAGASASEQADVDAGSAEYQRGEANCGTTQEGLAGGWKLHNQDQYIVVTDSYPTGTGQVIYAR
jgi:hypothetical protein